MNKITEATLIPLGLLGTLIGGAIWLSVIFYQGQANANDIDQLKQYQLEVIHKLSRIETKLESIENKKEN